MDSGIPVKFNLSALNFEEKSLIRAEQHQLLRGRNNSTSCRSPTPQFDTRSIKNELKEKRQLAFLKRRSLSPEMCGSKSSERQSERRGIFTYRSVTSETGNTEQSTPVILLDRSLSESPSSSKWTSSRSESALETQVPRGKSALNVQTTSVKTTQSEKVKPRLTQQSEFIQVKTMLREAGVQTESGSVTVRETDLQMLEDYLQEALWREQVLKKKLASLQSHTTNLMNSYDKIWTTCCSEDLLRNKIQALEAQLHVCLQKFPKEAVKKMLLQMERHKLVYEDKAVIALQKATQEKTEAVTKADTLQEALHTVQTEAQRWQRLYAELKVSSEQLTQKHHQSNEQLLQVHNKLELSRVREAELKQELASVKQQHQELQYNMCLLQEDNDVLREEMQNIRDGSSETEEVLMPVEPEQSVNMKGSREVEEQLQHTVQKLQRKEKECEELQTELSVMEQEYRSTHTRLSQCRDQLRQLTHRPRTSARGCPWPGWCLLLPLALAVVGGVLWLCCPPFREQFQDFCSDMESRIKDYVNAMSSPQHSSCFRPV